ncbi:hypothetical protein C8F01DRAFT_1256024 [Mycena amicta]|nr:hypothetical protein C8F01DRAFT_1256024 [Mycena amicta]
MRPLPQPPDDHTVEGCLVVPLHDTREDVQHLLDALHDPQCSRSDSLPESFVYRSNTTFKPYFIPPLVGFCRFEYPTTFAEFRALKPDSPIRYTYDGTKTLFEVVQLAREAQLWSVLPCAYLRIIIATLSDPTKSQSLCIRQPDGSTIQLAAIDQEACLNGAHRIMDALWHCNDLWGWFFSESVSVRYSEPAACASRKEKMFKALVRKRSFIGPRGLAFTKVENGWTELPVLLGLPNWDDLKNDL